MAIEHGRVVSYTLRISAEPNTRLFHPGAPGPRWAWNGKSCEMGEHMAHGAPGCKSQLPGPRLTRRLGVEPSTASSNDGRRCCPPQATEPSSVTHLRVLLDAGSFCGLTARYHLPPRHMNRWQSRECTLQEQFAASNQPVVAASSNAAKILHAAFAGMPQLGRGKRALSQGSPATGHSHVYFLVYQGLWTWFNRDRVACLPQDRTSCKASRVRIKDLSGRLTNERCVFSTDVEKLARIPIRDSSTLMCLD